LNSQSALDDVSLLLSQFEYKTSISHDNRLINISFSRNSFEPTNNIIEKFLKAGSMIYDIRRQDMSLEDVFFKLTEPETRKRNNMNSDYIDNRQKYGSETSRPDFQIKGGKKQREGQQQQKKQKKIDTE
jgi:hypothetical protein